MKKNNWLFLFLITVVSACSFPSKEEVKFKQYKVAGQQLYQIHCSNCHQIDGKGLGKVYPSLNQSDYMAANLDKVLCIMRNGMKEEIIVNGVTYNQLMPGVPELTDLEVAEIATYIYNSWGNEEGLIGVGMVSKKSNECN